MCQNCGVPVSSKYGYCQRNADCRRLYKRELARALYDSSKHRQYYQKYYQKNRDRILARERARPPRLLTEEQRIARREYHKEWRQKPGRNCGAKGCEADAVIGLLYCREHVREKSRRGWYRRHQRVAATLFDLQEGLCPPADRGGCGRALGDVADCHVDHLVPLALGGSDHISNLQLMHAFCNQSKSDRVVAAARPLIAGG